MKYNAGYKDVLFKLRCAPDLLSLGLYPNIKEWAESYSIFSLVRDICGSDVFKKPYNLVSVGDGIAPRTASLFAFMTKWQCWSIDPALRLDEKYQNISRLHLVNKKIEDVKLSLTGFTVILMVHSHASEETTLEQLDVHDGWLLLSMPCCNKPTLDTAKAAHLELEIPTLKNMVYIWNNGTSIQEHLTCHGPQAQRVTTR